MFHLALGQFFWALLFDDCDGEMGRSVRALERASMIGAVMGFFMSLSVGLTQFSMTNLVEPDRGSHRPLCQRGLERSGRWGDRAGVGCWEQGMSRSENPAGPGVREVARSIGPDAIRSSSSKDKQVVVTCLLSPQFPRNEGGTEPCAIPSVHEPGLCVGSRMYPRGGLQRAVLGRTFP